MNNDDLITMEEFGEELGISLSTVKRFIAESDIEADGVVQTGTSGRPKLTYKRSNLTLYWDKNKVATMTESGKMKFMIGHIELEGTEEQRLAIRDYVDQQVQLAVEAKNKQVLQLTADNNRLEQECDEQTGIAIHNVREYTRLLKRLPDSMKTKEQRDWEKIPSASSFDWMFKK